jgi:membrane dipeptidase
MSFSSQMRKRRRLLSFAPTCFKRGKIRPFCGLSQSLSSGGLTGSLPWAFIIKAQKCLKDNDISAESFVGNIGYVAELVVPEHVGLGLDFFYYPEQFYRQVLNNPGLWREEYRQNLDGFRYFPSEELPLVTEILINRG